MSCAMIAVPITAATAEQAIADIKLANEKADAIELRLDFLEEVNETILQELIEQCKKPVIVTYRSQNYGVGAEQTERLFLLQKASEFGASYIDVEFNPDADNGFLSELSKGNARIILSYHNFNGTPALPELLRILSTMLSLPCDAVKIVTFANSEQDNHTVLTLIPAVRKQGKQIVAFCMGPKGRKSRIESIKLGALLSFASLEKGKESAAGQLTIDEMRKELEEKNNQKN